MKCDQSKRLSASQVTQLSDEELRSRQQDTQDPCKGCIFRAASVAMRKAGYFLENKLWPASGRS